jgi:hypothetical protein
MTGAMVERQGVKGDDGDSSGELGHDPVRGKLLVLSVVHPDYLPSLYALSTVLERHRYATHIFSFASPAASSAAWERVNLHSHGEQRGGAFARWSARRALVASAATWCRAHLPVALVATCPFTLVAALRLAERRLPVIYFAYETYEVRPREALRSPMSWWRSRAAFRRVREAALVCVPSAERAGWLLARGALDRSPTVVMNCPALPRGSLDGAGDLDLLPHLRDRAVVVHTGRVSHAQAILELVQSVEHWPRDAALVVTNMGSSAYEAAVRESAQRSPRAGDIALLPAIGRSQMLSLQRAAKVGVFLTRDTDALETLMPAPNKVGEYVHAGLVTVAPRSPFMEQLARHGVVEMVEALTPREIGAGVERALARASVRDQRSRVLDVARDWYNMEVQARPVIRLLDSLRQTPTVHGQSVGGP